MDELWYEKVAYKDAKELIRENLANTVISFVIAGYWLKNVRDSRGYEKDGYLSVWEMAEGEFGLKKSEASRAMSMNDKYSVGGNSPVMQEKYKGYNKSQLQEMLTMTEEQLEQVSEDMTIKEIRQIKKQGAADEQIGILRDFPTADSVATSQDTVITVSDALLDAEIIEEIVEEEEEAAVLEFELLEGEEDADIEEKVIIIDGDFRELPVEDGTMQEVSVLEFPNTVYPEGSSLFTAGCGNKHNCFSCAQNCDLRQEDRYCREAPLGNPFTCTTIGVLDMLKEEFTEECPFINHDLAEHRAGDGQPVPCCKQCQVYDCGYRCNRAVKAGRKEEIREEAVVREFREAAGQESGLSVVKGILDKEKQLLHDYLEVGGLPEFTVERQKIIVGALANMVCELEEQEAEPIVEKQPELTILKNYDQRQEFIADYEKWPVWIEQPLTGERYYRYEFEDGTAFVVKAYFHKCFDYKAHGKWEDRYRDDWGAEEYYIIRDEKHFKDCLTNKSGMIEFLKNMQKEKKK